MSSGEPKRRGGIGVVGVGFLVLGGLVAWLLVPMVRHNLNHSRFERRFRELPLPGDTSVVATVSHFGLLVGNGNHCNSLAVSLLRTTRTRADLEDFYRDRTTPAAEGGAAGVELRLEPLGDAAHPGDLRTWYGFDAWTEFRGELAQPPPGSLYVLYALDQYSSNSDFRCH